MIKVVIILLLIIIAALLIVGVVDGNRFVVAKQQFVLPNLRKNCRFVMVSDLHNKVYGKDNDKVIREIEQANPDFILIVGDLVTSHQDEPVDTGIQFVNALSGKYRIYYSPGNHESKLKYRADYYGDMYNRLMKGIQHENVKILSDETISLEEYGIALTGFELGLEYFKRFKKRPMPLDYMNRKLGKPLKEYCNILMAHNPEYFEEYAKWGADLVLSGHVHGGIMRLPLVGGVISPAYTLFPKYDGGIFHSGKTTMLLGRGMGSHTIQLRFFNPAELYVVDLVKGE